MFCLSVIRLVFYLFPSSLKVNKKIIKGRICFSVIWFRFLVVMEYTLETHKLAIRKWIPLVSQHQKDI